MKSCDWMRKIQWKNVLLASFIYLVIAFIIRQIEVFITMNYYLMPQYFSVWSKLMMPKAGPPPPEFLWLSILSTLITGLVLAIIYDLVKGMFPKNYWQKVFVYTKLMVILTLVFSYLPLYLLINLPLGLLVTWFISGAVTIFLGTTVFAKLIK